MATPRGIFSQDECYGFCFDDDMKLSNVDINDDYLLGAQPADLDFKISNFNQGKVMQVDRI